MKPGKSFHRTKRSEMFLIQHNKYRNYPMARGGSGPDKTIGQLLLLCVCLGALLALGGCATESQSDPQVSRVHFVSAAALGGGDGMSWETAFDHPQDALDAARDGDQVWVAQGIYGPLDPTGGEVVRLESGVVVLGGFTGTEFQADQRAPGSAVTVLDGQGSSFHVVTGADRAVIDGFTVTGGSAVGNMPQSSSGGTYSGGGMFNAGVSPEVRNCLFVGNTASFNGGAIFNEDSDPLIVDCVFEDNTANFGGAMDNRGSSPTLVNVKFKNNTSIISGGAAANFDGSPVFINVVFSGNSSGQIGGAVLSNSSDAVYTNCSFTGNKATTGGGGIGMWQGKAQITNSILWDNQAGDGNAVLNVNGVANVNFSIVQGGFAGTGNQDRNPNFMQEGQWGPDGQWMEGDYKLTSLSPAVDSGTAAGAPAFDADYIRRPQFLAHDLGAFERSGP